MATNCWPHSGALLRGRRRAASAHTTVRLRRTSGKLLLFRWLKNRRRSEEDLENPWGGPQSPPPLLEVQRTTKAGCYTPLQAPLESFADLALAPSYALQNFDSAFRHPRALHLVQSSRIHLRRTCSRSDAIFHCVRPIPGRRAKRIFATVTKCTMDGRANKRCTFCW